MSPTRPSPSSSAVSSLACRQCRALKVRCVRDESSPVVCHRCSGHLSKAELISERLHLPCTPQSATRRGRPSTRRSASPGLTPGLTADRQAISTSPTTSRSLVTPGFEPSDLPSVARRISQSSPPPCGCAEPHLHAMNSLPTLKTNPEPSPQNGYSDPGSSRSNAAGMSVPSLATPRDPYNITMAEHIDRDDIADLLDPRDGFVYPPVKHVPSQDTVSRERRVFEHEDPVNLGMVSLVEAEHLVHKFMERLNPLIALLEPNLQTIHYLRQTSTLLFSTVLAASSKFFKKDVYAPLLSHANTIAGRAVLNGDETKALIQSLLILVYFKKPEDRSAWRKIGWAIRIAYQFNWHHPRRRPLPEDRLAALEALDQERTWILLYVFDRSYSRPFGLPYTIRPHEIGEVETWAQDHPAYYNANDMHLACVSECQRLRESWEAIVQQHSQGTDTLHPYQAVMVADVESRSLAMWNKWFGPISPPGFIQQKELRTKWTFLDLKLATKRYQLLFSLNPAAELDQYLRLVGEVVDIMETLAELEILSYLQDLSSAATSVLVLFLRKLFKRFSLGQQAIAVALLERILRCHEACAKDPTDAAAFVARFIRRILASIGQEVDEMRPQPTNDRAAELQNFAFENLTAQLDPFTNPANGIDFSTIDDQYWSQLMGATTSMGGWMSASVAESQAFVLL